MNKALVALALCVQSVVAASDPTSFPSAPLDPFADLRRAQDARNREQAREIALKEKRFVDSFNGLAEALDEFSKTYKATHTIDVKKVRSIREAYRRLEQANAWFQPE